MKTTTQKQSSTRVRMGLSAIGAALVLLSVATPASARDYEDRYDYRETTRHYDARHHYQARHNAPPPNYGHGYGHNKHHKSYYRPVYYSTPHYVAPAPVYYRDYPHHNQVDIHFQQRY